MSSDHRPVLGVGMVGHAFMGAAHSHAWRTAGRFFDLPYRATLTAVAGRNREAVAEAASRLGFSGVETDWKRLIDRDDVHLVDICTPGDSHAEIAIAALEAGKHVLCEKPMANSVAEAKAMADAAARASARGVRSMVGFNYRRVPALALARQLVAEGRLGEIRHVRAQYLQDWLIDPEFPLLWRLRREHAGSGALGDLGSHLIDLVQHLTGQAVTAVSALTETFVTQRPLPAAQPGAPSSGESGPVTVDDCALFLARFAQGAVGTFEATRFAAGRKNALCLEVNGSRGSIGFDLESMNELTFYDHTDDARHAGPRRILATEASHPYLEAWWPPGHLLGYEHPFTHQVVDLLRDIDAGRDPAPSFADGLVVQRVLEAVQRSADQGSWQQLDPESASAVGSRS